MNHWFLCGVLVVLAALAGYYVKPFTAWWKRSRENYRRARVLEKARGVARFMPPHLGWPEGECLRVYVDGPLTGKTEQGQAHPEIDCVLGWDADGIRTPGIRYRISCWSGRVALYSVRHEFAVTGWAPWQLEARADQIDKAIYPLKD